jgi:hypothetical protein
MQRSIGDGAMFLEEITLALFAACNSFRVVAYVPQILKAANDKNGASSISFMTWFLFPLAHLSTVAYALINRSDWGLAACFAVTPSAALPYWASRTGNGGATLSGCATRIGLRLVWRRREAGMQGWTMAASRTSRPSATLFERQQ